MSKNDQGGRALAPRAGGPVDERNDKALRDPISVAMEVAGSDDPSVQELVAFRRQAIDLKSAARSAKSLQSEEFRLGLFDVLEHDIQERVCAGLQIMSLSLVALTAIWPADDLDMAEAKLALAEQTGALHHRRDKTYVSTIDATLARRIRWKRGAFAVPELMLPPAPTGPQGDQRGLATWPLERWDLSEGLELRGGPPAYAHNRIAGSTVRSAAAHEVATVGFGVTPATGVSREAPPSSKTSQLASIRFGTALSASASMVATVTGATSRRCRNRASVALVS